jgi:hypothetical protein
MHIRRLASLVAALTIAATSAAIVPAASAAPVACSTFLQPYVNWVLQNEAENYVSYSMASNQSNQIVGYAEGGRLTYKPANPMFLLPARLATQTSGDSTQYFSDRRHGIGFLSYPFSPTDTDKLRLTINIASGYVTLNLVDWGSQIHFTGECENGVMYGFGDTLPIKSLFILALRKETAPIPS